LSCYWQRWLQIDPHRKRLQKQIKEVASQLKMAEERVAQEIVQKNIEEKSLELIDDLAMLQAKKKQLLHEIEIILDKLRLHKIEYHIHSYNDGYAKGERVLNELSAEELKQFKEQYFTLENLAHKAKSNGSDKVATFGTNKENNTLRPHQAIRKMIADKFNEE
jgi:hypothetical protein